jgi:hypothetical protein
MPACKPAHRADLEAEFFGEISLRPCLTDAHYAYNADRWPKRLAGMSRFRTASAEDLIVWLDAWRIAITRTRDGWRWVDTELVQAQGDCPALAGHTARDLGTLMDCALHAAGHMNLPVVQPVVELWGVSPRLGAELQAFGETVWPTWVDPAIDLWTWGRCVVGDPLDDVVFHWIYEDRLRACLLRQAA